MSCSLRESINATEFFPFQLHHETNIFILFGLMLEVVFAFGLVFIVCEIGERISTAFNEIDDVIDQFKWYLLPAEVQRMLPTIILNVQQKVALKCFGSISCQREAFRKVSSIF